MSIALSNTAIPEHRQDAVRRALAGAFGVDVVEEAHLLTGGLSSALVFRIVVGGEAYLLRVIMRTDAMGDPTRQIAVMRPAAEAGIAPRVRYASVDDRVLITDYIEGTRFPDDPALPLARAIRTLQTLPAFPPPMMGHYLNAVDNWVRKVRESGVLPASRTEAVFQGYDAIARVYPRYPEHLVASHNDLKPENIRFDGTRMVFVDWEAAFLNDQYFDLAVVANFFVEGDPREAAYLAEFFGRPADDYERARFVVMRQIVHVAYASFLLMMVANLKHPIDPDAPAERFDDFHRLLLSGSVTAGTNDGKFRYALVHLEAARRNLGLARLEDALDVVWSARR